MPKKKKGGNVPSITLWSRCLHYSACFKRCPSTQVRNKISFIDYFVLLLFFSERYNNCFFLIYKYTCQRDLSKLSEKILNSKLT